MRAVEVGHHVVGFDDCDELAAGLATGFSHVEDVPASQVKAALATGRYRVTSSPDALGDFDVAVITVPTPICDETPDLSYVESAGKSIAPSVRPGSTVILES